MKQKSMRRWALGLALMLLLTLTAACGQSEEDQALLEYFRDQEAGVWARREARSRFTPGAGYDRHLEEIDSYGGYGAEVQYALYQSRENSSFLYLRQDTADGSDWRRYYHPAGSGDYKRSRRLSGEETPREEEQTRLIGEFSIKLEPLEDSIPRAEADPAVLEEIRQLLEPECAGGVAYVNTQQLYAVVVTGRGNTEDVLAHVWRSGSSAALYELSRSPEDGQLSYHRWFFAKDPLNWEEWFYAVACADAMIHFPA